MDLSFNLTSGQQWLLLFVVVIGGSFLLGELVRWYYNQLDYKANWTARLAQFKKG